MIVAPGPQSHCSHLFTVRLWAEEVREGRTEWRGQVTHVLSGKARYFREWPTLIAFLEQVAREDRGDVPLEPPSNQGEHI
jgi:hypothetical protein